MLRTIKPKNARSKRALDAREPQVEENEKTAIFVRGEKISEPIKVAMKDLYALKSPNAVNFSKKNPIHPFDADPSRGVNSLEFFSGKNDASLFVVGTHSKKRPNGLVWVRCFNGQVLDMIEVGLTNVVGMNDIKSTKSTPGHKFLMTFQSPLFTSHPAYIQLKSMLLDFFNGHEVGEIPLMGLESVMTITAGPMEGQTATLPGANHHLPDIMDEDSSSTAHLPPIHIRVYTMKLLSSGTRLPKLHLEEMGPRIDMTLRRTKAADEEILKLAMKRPKLEKKDVEKGQGKKRKNIETDEMGDLVGQIHIGKQELSSLQGRKMKGLKDPEARKGKKAKMVQKAVGEDADME